MRRRLRLFSAKSAMCLVHWLLNAPAFASLLLASQGAVAEGGLGPEFQVNTTDSYSRGGPDVGMSQTGEFLVVSWLTENEPNWSSFAQRFSSGGAPLGDDFQVFAYGCCAGLGPPGAPSIAVDASGRLVVVWGASPASGAVVLGRRAGLPTLPSLGAVALLGLAALALVAGVRSIQRASHR